MRAIVQDAWGTDPAATLEVRELDRPTIDDDAVLVRVIAASVDRGTVHCMTGQPYAMRLMGFGVRRPKAPNPGRALAGTVASVGKNVQGFEPGDEVYGSCDGSFAEYAPAQPDMLARKPANLSFEQAAAAPISGVTALQAVRKAGVAPRTARAGHRSVGWRRHLRGADRQGLRRRGHRRVQHREGRTRPIPRCRPRCRLHPRADHGRRSPIRRDPRHRRQPNAVRAPPRSHRSRHPGDRRRGDRWTLARGFDRSLRASFSRPSSASRSACSHRRRTPPTLTHSAS